jgi:endonuclease/exonuclease/phosphatase family metal-dependent hydrolase
VRVVTYNLLHGLDVRSEQVDLDAVARAIEALGADVVAVQEVDRGLRRTDERDQVAEIAKRLGWHGIFAPALLGDPTGRYEPPPRDGSDPGGPAYGIGLLSPHPLRAPARKALPGGGPGESRPRPEAEEGVPPKPGWDGEPRAALRAVVRCEGRDVAVTTAHLSYMPWRGARQLRVAAAFAGALRGPAVLLGDLNLPFWSVRGAVTGSRWRVTPAACTFPSWQPHLQLDHLLVRGLVVDDVRVGPRGPSDHLPLGATLRVH